MLDVKLKNLFGEDYGPKPISIENYIKKNGPLNRNPTSIPVKKLRGGIAARRRAEKARENSNISGRKITLREEDSRDQETGKRQTSIKKQK